VSHPITGSRYGLASSCPPSHVLPWADDVHEAAEGGAIIHRYALLDAPLLGREAALKLIADPDLREFAEGIDVESTPICDPSQFVQEIAIAYNPETDEARELGRGSASRDYRGRRPGEVAATLDALGVGADAVIYVDLKKTGRWLGRPEEYKQLRFGALLSSRLLGRSSGTVGLCYARTGEALHYEWGDLDAWTLDDVRDEVRLTLAEIEAAEKYQEGRIFRRDPNTCRFCPAFDSCPAWRQLLEAAATSGGRFLEQVVAGLQDSTDRARREAKRIADEIDVLSKQLNRRVSDSALVRAIPLGEGRFYGSKPGSERVYDHETAISIVREVCGEAAAQAASTVKVATSKKAIHAAAGEKAVDVLRELRRRGAVEKRPSFGEYTAANPTDDHGVSAQTEGGT
jgi:hypothetical protein